MARSEIVSTSYASAQSVKVTQGHRQWNSLLGQIRFPFPIIIWTLFHQITGSTASTKKLTTIGLLTKTYRKYYKKKMEKKHNTSANTYIMPTRDIIDIYMYTRIT